MIIKNVHPVWSGSCTRANGIVDLDDQRSKEYVQELNGKDHHISNNFHFHVQFESMGPNFAIVCAQFQQHCR